MATRSMTTTWRRPIVSRPDATEKNTPMITMRAVKRAATIPPEPMVKMASEAPPTVRAEAI